MTNEATLPPIDEVPLPKRKATGRPSAHLSLGLDRLTPGKSILVAKGRQIGRSGIKADERFKDWTFKFAKQDDGSVRIYRVT